MPNAEIITYAVKCAEQSLFLADEVPSPEECEVCFGLRQSFDMDFPAASEAEFVLFAKVYETTKKQFAKHAPAITVLL